MGEERDTTTNLSEHCLSLDLEVGVKDRRIHGFAAVRPDTVQSLRYPAGRDGLATALNKLDDFADGVDFLLGHNLIDFDLPHLRAANPNLRLLRLPAVDTLRLNPLAFPATRITTWLSIIKTDNSNAGASTTRTWMPDLP